MEVYRFGREVGRQIEHFDSNFVMSRISMTEEPAHIGCMHLEAGGVVGLHEAPSPQLLLIVNGHGLVRTDKNDGTQVASGDAVFWQTGEWHETRTETGLTAIIIESSVLNPANFMPLVK